MDLNDVVEKALAGRWIAGDSVDDAIKRARKFNSRSVKAIINYLGEEFIDIGCVDDAVRTYVQLIKRIKSSGVDADVSLKLTQLGLWIDKGIADRNYAKIVSLARKNGITVWIDAEMHRDIGDTVAIYKKHLNGGLTGITVQSSLRGSMDEIKDLVRVGGAIRLVKGAYREPLAIGFADRAAVTRNYYRLMDYLFRYGGKFVIATHDLDIVKKALALEKSYGKDVEHAMLNGIRNEYALKLAAEGHSVYVYVPFGRRWVDYSYRRLREASNVKLLLKSLGESQDI